MLIAPVVLLVLYRLRCSLAVSAMLGIAHAAQCSGVTAGWFQRVPPLFQASIKSASRVTSTTIRPVSSFDTWTL
jgi:hypothetical protein